MKLPWPTRAQKVRAAGVLADYARTLSREERGRWMVGFDAEGLTPHSLVDVTAAPNEHAYVFCAIPDPEGELSDVCLAAVERAVVERQRRVETHVDRLRHELQGNLRSVGVVGDVEGDFSDPQVVLAVLEALPEDVVERIWVIDPDITINSDRAGRMIRATFDQLVNATCELYSALVVDVGRDS